VIGMVLPATHSVPTMVSNAVNILAAGNTAVFSPHPAGARVAAYALALFNRKIAEEVGIANVITTVAEPSIESAQQIFEHPDVALLCVTGGPAVVKAAAQSGKRVIAGGPGNPPVVVDEGADLDLAARSIIDGAAFDNNLLCIGEKEIFVVESVADDFIEAMVRAGAVQLNASQIEKLTDAAFTFDGPGKGCGRAHVKRDLLGQDAAVLAAAAGLNVPRRCVMLFGETPAAHPFVQEEQMMPFLPIVRVPDFDAGVKAAVQAEHGYRHTAIVHTKNVEHATRMARAMNTTLFVQNAASTAALGVNGPGYFSHTVATPTGEGVTTPLTFTRQRQFAVGHAMRFI
jgi:aldehyde dehydrogenase